MHLQKHVVKSWTTRSSNFMEESIHANPSLGMDLTREMGSNCLELDHMVLKIFELSHPLIILCSHCINSSGVQRPTTQPYGSSIKHDLFIILSYPLIMHLFRIPLRVKHVLCHHHSPPQTIALFSPKRHNHFPSKIPIVSSNPPYSSTHFIDQMACRIPIHEMISFEIYPTDQRKFLKHYLILAAIRTKVVKKG